MACIIRLLEPQPCQSSLGLWCFSCDRKYEFPNPNPITLVHTDPIQSKLLPLSKRQ